MLLERFIQKKKIVHFSRLHLQLRFLCTLKTKAQYKIDLPLSCHRLLLKNFFFIFETKLDQGLIQVGIYTWTIKRVSVIIACLHNHQHMKILSWVVNCVKSQKIESFPCQSLLWLATGFVFCNDGCSYRIGWHYRCKENDRKLG